MADLRALRRPAVLFCTAVVTGALATLAITLVASAVFGHKVLAISSATMEPTLSDGDLLIAPEVSPGEIEEGDLITFSEPERGRTITRRVTAVGRPGGRVFFETRGDASGDVRRFSVPEDGQVGKPLRRIPLLGDLLDALTSATLLLLLPLLILFGIGCAELSDRFRRAPGTSPRPPGAH